MMSELPITSTTLLGIDLAIALDKSRKETHASYCVDCNRKHCGVYHCEFCLANELYTRRKSMAFMRLDLCVQAAVCLIAKSGTSGAQARGTNYADSQTHAYAQIAGLNKITKLNIGDDNAKD